MKKIKEIADELYGITIPLFFRLKHVNIFAALHGKRVTLFDTGPNLPTTFPVLKESLKHIGRSVEDIDRIFITHSHPDHCGIAGLIKEISGAAIHMSEIEFETIKLNFQSDRRKELVGTFCHQHGLDKETIHDFGEYIDSFGAITYPLIVDHYLSEKEPLFIGRKRIKILPTPGHTRGHVCFLFADENILIAGDNILPHITPNLSPDVFCPAFRPLQSYIGSLEMIEDLKVKAVYPAHGTPFKNLKRRVEEIKEHHRKRKELALNALKRCPKTAKEVSIDIFGADLPVFDRVLALNETYVHLVELEKEFLITQYTLGETVIFKTI